MLNTGRLTMPPGFKGERIGEANCLEIPYFKDGKISPEMWQVVAELREEPTASRYSIYKSVLLPRLFQKLFQSLPQDVTSYGGGRRGGRWGGGSSSQSKQSTYQESTCTGLN